MFSLYFYWKILFYPSSQLSLIFWTWMSGHVLFWLSRMQVFYILVFELVQCNWACFTRKGTVEIKYFFIFIIIIRISGTDLLQEFYVLPHWDRNWRENFLSHPVTVYWHWAGQSQCRPCKGQASGRVVSGVPMFKSLVWLELEKDPCWKQESNPNLSLLRWMPHH